MGKGRALVNKLKRRKKYLNETKGLRTIDKIDLKDEKLKDSPRAYKLLEGIKRRLDRKFSQQLQPSPEKVTNEFMAQSQITGVDPILAEASTFVGQVAGMTTNVTITADVAGTAGDVTLVADSVSDIDTLIAAWNLANPTNTLTLTAGDGTQIPTADITLSGGVDFVQGTLTLVTPAGLIRAAGLMANDYVKVLEGGLAGQELKVLTVDYGTDTITLEYAPGVTGLATAITIKMQLSGVKKSYT